MGKEGHCLLHCVWLTEATVSSEYALLTIAKSRFHSFMPKKAK